jgi:predicted phage tail protein
MKTKIKIHGILAKEFGSEYAFANIRKPIDCVKAIKTIHSGFENKISELAKLGMNYELIVDGEIQNAFSMNQNQSKIKKIEIVPCVMGNVPAAFFIGLGWSAGAAAVASFVATTLIVGLVVAGIGYLLAPIPSSEVREMTAALESKSFFFSSRNNIASQGDPIPIGYGRLRVGSHVVASNLINENRDVVSNPNSYIDDKSDLIAGLIDSFFVKFSS